MQEFTAKYLPSTPVWATSLIIILLLIGDPASAASDPAVIDLIDLNRASATELMTLPGIGEQRAHDIVEFRLRRPFRRRRDLLRVHGIGRRTYFRLKRFIRVAPVQPARAHETKTAS